MRQNAANSQHQFERVFSNVNALDSPFTDEVEERAILFPMSFRLLRPEMDALEYAAKTVGDHEFFLTLIETEGTPRMRLRFTDYDLYDQVVASETAICGASQPWGLIFSHMGHAIIGGPRPFLAALRDRFPPVEPGRRAGERARRPLSFDEQLSEFLRAARAWRREGSELPWLPTLLQHVYGPREAKAMLARTQ